MMKKKTNGSIQRAGRPAVVVSNNVGNEHATIVEIIYLTSRKKKQLPTHCTINSTKYESIALCEQVHTITKDKLENYIGSCTAEEMEKINKCLMISLGLL